MIEELIERYSQYTDSELIQIYNNKSGYTEEAKKALEIVINEKGGIDLIQSRNTANIEKQNEKSKLNEEIKKMYDEGMTINDISMRLSASTLSQEEIDEVVNQKFNFLEEQKNDLSVNSGTIIGSVFGGLLGGIIGGILWGLQMIYSGRMFYIFLLGLFFISYGFIKLLTKKSRNNIAVFIATALSVLFALMLGIYMYDYYGYQGVDRHLE